MAYGGLHEVRVFIVVLWSLFSVLRKRKEKNSKLNISSL